MTFNQYIIQKKLLSLHDGFINYTKLKCVFNVFSNALAVAPQNPHAVATAAATATAAAVCCVRHTSSMSTAAVSRRLTCCCCCCCLLFVMPQSSLTPAEVVDRLDRFIVGQSDAKKAVAVAFRNRWRRHRVPAQIQVQRRGGGFQDAGFEVHGLVRVGVWRVDRRWLAFAESLSCCRTTVLRVRV